MVVGASHPQARQVDEALRDIAETLVLENPRFIVGALLLRAAAVLCALQAAVGTACNTWITLWCWR